MFPLVLDVSLRYPYSQSDSNLIISDKCGISPLLSPLPAAPAENADFEGGVTRRRVDIRMDLPTVSVPLPLNDDTVIEGDEQFLCFITARGAGVSGGRVMLTVQDDDMSEWAIPKS